MSKPKMRIKALIPLLIAFLALVSILYFFGGSFSLAPLSATAELRNIDVVNPVISPSGQVIIKGEVYSESGGPFYVEAGLVEKSRQPLAILTASRSACDRKTQYAGGTVTLVPKGTASFEFRLSSYGVEGKYDLVVGVYRGCTDALELAGETQKVYAEKYYKQSITVQIPPSTTTTTPQFQFPTDTTIIGTPLPKTPTTLSPTITPAPTTTSTTSTTSKPDGVIEFVDVKPETGTKYVLGEPIIITGTFKATGDGRNQYLLEGAVRNAAVPLAIAVSADRSICDSSRTDFASQIVTLDKGEIANFKFSVIPRAGGKSTIEIYATNGCASVLKEQYIVYSGPLTRPIDVGGDLGGGGDGVSVKVCEVGTTKQVDCKSLSSIKTGLLSYTCQSSGETNSWALTNGECKQSDEKTCASYQNFRDGDCKFALGKFFTTSGLSSFGSENPVISVLLIIALMAGIFYLTPIIQKKLKKRR